MTMDDSVSIANQAVTIELLDPTYERPVKAWTFADRTSITIGRGDDQDVEISDVYVSRAHVKLSLRDGVWILNSLGRNGVLIDNRQVNNVELESGGKFRLGSGGPFVRFQIASKKTESAHTICFDTFPAPLFALDETKLRHEVSQIAEGDYFQSLQDKAKLLRKQRGAN